MTKPQSGASPDISLLAAPAPLAIVAAIAMLGALPGRSAAQERPHIEFDMSVLAAQDPFLQGADTGVTYAGEIAMRTGGRIGIDHRTELEVDAGIGLRQYDSTFGSFVTGNVRARLDHRNDEHLSLVSEAVYDRSLPLEASATSIDSAIDPVSIQNRWTLAQQAIWRTDERNTLTGTVTWSKIDPEDSVLLETTTGTSLALSSEHRLDERTWVGLEGIANFTHSPAGGDPSSKTLRLQAGYQLGPYWTSTFSAGLSWISRDFETGGRDRTPALFTGMVSLCHEPRRLRACLSASTSPVLSSFGGIQREKSFSGSIDWQASEHGSITATADYRAAPRMDEGGDTTVTRLSARYAHALGQNLSVYTGAQYHRRTGIGPATIDSWTILIGTTLRIPQQ